METAGPGDVGERDAGTGEERMSDATGQGERPSGMEAALARYLAIQTEEQALREEKSGLQQRIAAHMEQDGRDVWFPEVQGQRLKIRSVRSTVVEYDEEKLKVRLGERYGAILAPDPRKIRRNLGAVEAALAPFLDVVGSPSADRVRNAIERGVVRSEEFAGAFTKTARSLVSVSRVRSSSGPPAPDDPGNGEDDGGAA
jgi:hypothetical protein